MLLRFVDGRPVSAVTMQFLAWLTAWLAAEGKTALLLVWDKASWHVSQAVRAWLKAHNRQVKREGGCRVVVCPCRLRARGSIGSSPNGSMASARLRSQIVS